MSLGVVSLTNSVYWFVNMLSKLSETCRWKQLGYNQYNKSINTLYVFQTFRPVHSVSFVVVSDRISS
jgi:hypothetical protein